MFPHPVIVRWAVHHDSDQPRDARISLPVYRLRWRLQRLRRLAGVQLGGYDLGQRRYGRWEAAGVAVTMKKPPTRQRFTMCSFVSAAQRPAARPSVWSSTATT